MTSVFAVIQDVDKNILFLQRAAGTSRPLQWTLPGGKRKINEDSVSAVVREVLEETALSVHVVQPLADFGDQSYWLCELLSSVTIILRDRESCAFAWCHPSNILELGFIMDLKRLQQVLKVLDIELDECR